MIGRLRRWFRRREEERRLTRWLIRHAAWVDDSLMTLRRHDPDLAIEAARAILEIMDRPEDPDDLLAQPREVHRYLMGVLERGAARHNHNGGPA